MVPDKVHCKQVPMSISFRLALLAALTLANGSRAATIFTNLGQPGDLSGPDSVGVGSVPVPGLFIYHATNFTPLFTGRLTSIVIPMGVASGPNEIDVQLLRDAAGLPGSVIESFHIVGLPPLPVANQAFASILQPVLNTGEQYWLSVTGGTPTSFVFWNLTLFNGDSAAGGATRLVSFGNDAGWGANPGTRVGAIALQGDPIPEPVTLVSVGVGLALMGRSLRRRHI